MSLPAPPLSVSPDQRRVLGAWVRSRVVPPRQVQRARLVLLAADGVANEVIASRLGLSKPTVLKWRGRFEAAGVDGLEEAAGRGRSPVYGQEFIETVASATLQRPPGSTTHWSTRTLADHLGASHATINRIWQDMGLHPHLTQAFTDSSDPLPDDVTDIVGLYLNPPENAIALSLDEKSQIQAPDGTPPHMLVKPAPVERHTHGCTSQGLTTLFALLDVATGDATRTRDEPDRTKEFLAFLQLLVQAYPHQRLHLILDSVSSHNSQHVRRCLLRHRRVHIHFAPTSSSWLNQVKAWFSILSRRSIHRGAFTSLHALVDSIMRVLDTWDAHGEPIVWVKSAEQKLNPLCRVPGRQRSPASS